MNRVIVAVVIGLISARAWAGDCAQVDATMTAMATTPYSSVVTGTDPEGHPIASRMVQTSTHKYVQTHGKWIAMAISSKDLLDNLSEERKSGKITCTRAGSGDVNGQPAAIYLVHIESEDIKSASKVWISAQNLVLKSEDSANGMKGSVIYDYTHTDPPKDATPLGAH
ncbi:MAG TPA: hypothetical protein VMB71_15465 [Acetobacteraceae bacterium]|nr:hypothetical protein [Acetobacteraceae bacterium]